MHYLIDGYNVLFKLFEEGISLKEQRDYLIERLRHSMPPSGSVTLVFDAHFGTDLELRSHAGDLEIVYSSKGETADDWILGRIQRGKAYSFTVVTQDKSLIKACRFLGAHAKSGAAFFKQLKGREMEAPLKPEPTTNRVPLKGKRERPPSHIPPQSCFDYYLYKFENPD